jgi:hypothetical protein
MMSNYVIALYVSSNPGTYMICIRFAFQNRVWHRCATGVGDCKGRLRQKRKEIMQCSLSGGAPDCPMLPRTEGNNGLPNGAPTAPSCFGAIKGTPRPMEQHTKPPLNILRRLDSARTHLIHCVWDLSTCLSCELVALCCVLVSWPVCVSLLRLALACVSIPSLTLVV